MKKLIFTALSITLLAGGMTSCGKSTKGKMSNEWKVESYANSSTNTQQNGNKSVTTETFNGSTVTETTVTTTGNFSNTSTDISTLTNPTFKINKDGTWQEDKTIVTTEADTVINVIFTTTTTTVRMESGTWSFIGKNKEEEFKKNERVLFNTLATSRSTTVKITATGGLNPASPAATSNSSSYKAGEYVRIFTVTESKKKALELTSEEANVYTSGNTTESYVSSSKMNLVQ